MTFKTELIVDGGKYNVKKLLECCNKLKQAISAQKLKCNSSTSFNEEYEKLRVIFNQMIYLTANTFKLTGELDKVLLASIFLIESAFNWFESRIRSWFHEVKEDCDTQIN